MYVCMCVLLLSTVRKKKKKGGNDQIAKLKLPQDFARAFLLPLIRTDEILQFEHAEKEISEARRDPTWKERISRIIKKNTCYIEKAQIYVYEFFLERNEYFLKFERLKKLKKHSLRRDPFNFRFLPRRDRSQMNSFSIFFFPFAFLMFFSNVCRIERVERKIGRLTRISTVRVGSWA